MNLADVVAEKFTVRKTEARNQIESYTDCVLTVLKTDGRVRVAGLGTFRIKRIPARKAERRMNPFTHQMQDFPAKPAENRLKFTPAKEIKVSLAKVKSK